MIYGVSGIAVAYVKFTLVT